MDKIFNLIAVDDQPESLEPILAAVKELLSLEGLNLVYRILSKKNEVDKLKDFPCDIVMFDCALSGENFDFLHYEEARFGIKLLQDYRKQNRRTKIIFYSGSFDFEGEGNFDLTCLDFVQMINELNVFAISKRDSCHRRKILLYRCTYGRNGIGRYSVDFYGKGIYSCYWLYWRR